MSLIVFENYLKFVDQVVSPKTNSLSTTDATDATELESILVSHGVVLLFAHMEQCLRMAIEAKCNHCDDDGVRAFALSVKNEKTGKIGLQEVKGTLKRFGSACRDEFTSDLNKTLDLKESWDSIKAHRHTVAHEGKPAGLTLDDLREYYGNIRKILGLICKALGLTKAEVEKISKLIIFAPRMPEGENATEAS